MATTDARNRIRQPYRFYKPQFLDENRLKMDLDREFEDISQALLKVSEKFNMIDLTLDFDAGEVMDELNKIKSTIEVTIKRLGNLEEANSELSFKLTAQYNEMMGSLRHVNRVISNAQRALAEATLQLDAETISIQNDNARMSAHISRQDIVITDHEQAIARTNEKLDAAVETINNDILASIETTKEAIATLEESVASVETNMNSKYDSLSKVVDSNKKDADGKLAGLDGRMVTAEANIKTVQKTSADNTKAISEMSTEMSSKFTSVNNSINSTNQTVSTNKKDADNKINNTNNTVAANKKDADGKISNVNGRVDTIEGRVNTAEANIKTNAKTGADNKQAIASMETKMNAKFNEQEAKINTKAVTQFDHSGTGSATYEVNAGIKWNGKVTSAGMRIEASVSGGVMHSGVIFDADKFKVRNPSNGTFQTAFEVKGGKTYIRSALIDSAEVITEFKSQNFVSGKSGFRFDAKTGNAEMNDATFRGTLDVKSGSSGGRMTISNNQILVYDENNKLVVKIGYLG
ncbi:tail fiber protein [Proteus phage 3H10_20]|uniref:Tail fiber protein n=1 Tax=Proteus phage 3H10_20 TaxID=2772448 RepID=A0A7L7SRZ8_9CAUD|nr:tail fiber protein [Proteus phage 3H10_20]QOC54802.1 tail fiber protein [Proteus phage 3H10_20]